MQFLEKDLEDLIFEYAFQIQEKGLDLSGSVHDLTDIFRQVNLGVYGIADLIAVTIIPNDEKDKGKGYKYRRAILVNVIECKQNLIDHKAYFQAKRYVTALKLALSKFNTLKTNFIFTTTLIGKSVDSSSDFVYGYNEDESCFIYTYNYGYNGIEFLYQDKSWRITEAKPFHSKIGKILKKTFKQELVNQYYPF